MVKTPLAVIALALAVAACDVSALLSPAGPPKLGIANGTTLAVTLFVNGRAVASVPSGSGPPTIDTSAVPPLPWTVEARSPSGRVLTSMFVAQGDVTSRGVPNGGKETSGKFGRVDLSCGRLTVWAGDVEPSGPAPPSPAGIPGDCAP